MSLFEDPVSYFAGKLSTGSSVLDIGSKNGKFSEQFAKQGYIVTAIEPKSEGSASDVSVTNIATSIEEYQTSSSYDLVFARLVEHLMKGGQVCENLSLLRNFVVPGGLLYVTVFGKNDSWRRSVSVREDTEVCLASLGFEIIEFEESEFDAQTYAGELKHWHVLTYIAKRGTVLRKSKRFI